MKKVFILLALAFSACSFAQTKYFIYFKDKGETGKTALAKESPSYKSTLSALTEKCIERRTKTLGKENILTEDDIPVCEDYINRVKNEGIKIENTLKWFNAVTAFLTVKQAVLISGFDFVLKVEPVKTIRSAFTPGKDKALAKSAAIKAVDPVYADSYSQLALSDITAVHAKGITGKGVVIGLLDSGFGWKTHSGIKNANVKGEYDFVFHDVVTSDESEDAKGQQNHGTAVLSTIAANAPGIMMGAAYDASFYLAKTEYVPTETKTEEDNFAAGVEWLESRGVDIASTSLGYNIFDDDIGSYAYSDMDGKTAICTKAYEKAFSLGMLTVSSAGNEGNNSWKYITTPADGFNVLAAGSVTDENVIAASSSRGPTYDKRIKPDVTAQGVNDIAASAGTVNGYSYWSGTSFAAPIVCGAAALLLSAYPNLTNTQARYILMTTAKNSAAPNNDIGYGLVSAAKAISFPNIGKTGDNFVIKKIFLKNNGVKNNLVKLFISDDGVNFSQAEITYDNALYYSSVLQKYSENKKIYFYFDYTDTLNNNIREPENQFYSFIYGSADIKISGVNSEVSDYLMSQNYPNPFNGITNIEFTASEDGPAAIKIYDILGREIKTVYRQNVSKGTYNLRFYLTSLASGVYFYRLELNGKTLTKKMILNK
jgi:subtilisin family serine protease